MKRDQILAFMDVQKIDVLCLTDTRLSRKASKAFGTEARKAVGINAVICASGYISGIRTLSRSRRK